MKMRLTEEDINQLLENSSHRVLSTNSHAEYERNRVKAIKNGTWTPRKARIPIREPNELDWAWIAGYLEGEGSFSIDGSTLRIRADSIDREPIIRLLDLLGGGFSDGVTKTGTGKPLYRWALASKQAKPVMEQLMSMLSKRRQDQIRNVLLAYNRG